MPRLSNRIEAIEYVHATDGLPYRHRFKKGSRISLLKDGSVKVTNPSKKKLWSLFDVNGVRQPFLINPPAGTTHSGGTMAKKRKMSALQRKYFGGGKRRKNPARKRKAASATRTVVRYRNPPNPPTKKRRRRRNPVGLSVQGLLGRLQRGGTDALCVVGGRVGVRLVSGQFSYADGSMMDTLVEAGAALALGMVAERVIGQDKARFILAGGLSSSLETLLAQAKIPYVSATLGAIPTANTGAIYPSADRTLGAWSPAPTLGAWSPGEPPLAGKLAFPNPRNLVATMNS